VFVVCYRTENGSSIILANNEEKFDCKLIALCKVFILDLFGLIFAVFVLLLLTFLRKGLTVQPGLKRAIPA
jgi:hypothetical protein